MIPHALHLGEEVCVAGNGRKHFNVKGFIRALNVRGDQDDDTRPWVLLEVDGTKDMVPVLECDLIRVDNEIKQ